MATNAHNKWLWGSNFAFQTENQLFTSVIKKYNENTYFGMKPRYQSQDAILLAKMHFVSIKFRMQLFRSIPQVERKEAARNDIYCCLFCDVLRTFLHNLNVFPAFCYLIALVHYFDASFSIFQVFASFYASYWIYLHHPSSK